MCQDVSKRQGILTQSKGGDDLIQCTTDLFEDQSQLTRKADGSLSRSKSQITLGGRWAGESLFNAGSSTSDGRVDRGNVRFVGGSEGGCILAWSVRLKGCGCSVCSVMGQCFVAMARSIRRDIDLLITAVYCWISV